MASKDTCLTCALLWLLVGLFSMVLVYTLYPALNTDSFQDFIENQGYPTGQLCDMPLTSPMPELSGPGEATLDSPREPYHLLGDHLKSGPERLSNLKAECAYEANLESKIAKTGSFGQVTNNYKRSMPDNGSTWLRELSLSFYSTSSNVIR